MNRLQLFTGFLKRYWPRAVALVVMGLVASISTLLIPVSIGKFFDLLFGYHSRRAQVLDHLLPPELWSTLVHFQWFFLGIVALHFVFNYLFRFGTAMMGERFSKYLREVLFDHQMSIPLAVYEQSGTGKYLLRYSGDMKSAQDLFTKGMLRLGSDLIVLVLALGFMWWFDTTIFLVVLAGMLGSALVIRMLNRHLRRASVVRRNRRSGMLAFVSQRLRAMATILAFNRLTPERKKFLKRSERLLVAGRDFQRIYQLIFTLVPGLLYLILAASLFLVGREERMAHANHGNLLAFVLIFITIMPVFRRLLRAGLVWEMGLISVDKLLHLINLSVDDRHLPDFRFVRGEIVAEDLTFGHLPEKPLFRNLHFHIEPGKMYLVQGRTGSGKSTLIKLLMRLLPPQSGRILIDGQDIWQVNGFSLRKHLTVISHEFPLLGKTVFEAVSYNQKEKNRERAARLLERLQRQLPENRRLGLDTPIGELGSNLSSGEQKMLQYVRAMMTRKPILLIEEPFKGLHPKVKAEVVRWLQRQKGKKTIVLLTTTRRLRGIEPEAFMDLGQQAHAEKTSTHAEAHQTRSGQ